ncbi:MAG: hypothetical protein MZV70_68020 [Desulfobacterales bacterium]|nr:hypothetical protein [Desulfobacterales bacterium]
MVHQNFMLVDTMTVAENVVLGMPSRAFVPGHGRASKRAIVELAQTLRPDGRPGRLHLAAVGRASSSGSRSSSCCTARPRSSSSTSRPPC